MIKRVIHITGLLLCIVALQANAQQFCVRSFRLLPNDISAYIDPVRDLNQEACALIKVVGDRDFVFSTPLGIAHRRNEVGEIWIYLPHGSVQITIKHPKWGVLRDYRFPAPLESRLTYELTLSPPIVPTFPKLSAVRNRPAALDTTLYLPSKLPRAPMPRPRRPRERLHYLVLAHAGIYRGDPSAGIQVGIMRRHGAYLHVQSNFGTTPATQGECDRNGVPTDGSIAPYYTGKTRESRRMALAGALHHIAGGFCLYEGIGYGERKVAWEKAEGGYLRNTSLSSRGLSGELGGIFRSKRLALSAGVITINGKHWEANIGIGLHF